jgi:hypothetical protein
MGVGGRHRGEEGKIWKVFELTHFSWIGECLTREKFGRKDEKELDNRCKLSSFAN